MAISLSALLSQMLCCPDCHLLISGGRRRYLNPFASCLLAVRFKTPPRASKGAKAPGRSLAVFFCHDFPASQLNGESILEASERANVVRLLAETIHKPSFSRMFTPPRSPFFRRHQLARLIGLTRNIIELLPDSSSGGEGRDINCSCH